MKVTGTLLIPLAFLLSATANASEALYTSCAACHGAEAEGNKEALAPRLAGQQSSYLREQMKDYRDGRRGVHPDDEAGQMMRDASADLSDDNITALSAWLSELSVPAAAAGSSNEAGKELYESTCAACHGYDARGNANVVSPNLRILSDWYVKDQLESYMKGWRGGVAASTRSKGMRTIAAQLDEEEINAVVRYLDGLE